MLGLKSHLFQQITYRIPTFASIVFDAMHLHGLGNGFSDSDAWVERRVGVLKYNLCLFSEVAQGLAFQCGYLYAVKPHFAACRLNQTQDAAA